MSGSSGFGIFFGLVIGLSSGNWWLLASSLLGRTQEIRADKQRRRALRQYNDALVDRLEMVEGDPRQPRTRAYGRVRTVEGVRRRPFTSGTNQEKLTFFPSFAGHEVDAFEAWYLNEYPVTLDGSGWVLPMSLGTGTGYKTNAAGYAIGATSITLTTGTGTILAGDKVRFDGDATFYNVATGITAPGAIVLSAPGLRKPLAASAINVTVAQNPFAPIKRSVSGGNGTLDGSGNGSFALPGSYISGTIEASWSTGTGETFTSGNLSVSIVGSTVNLSGGPASAAFNYYYEVNTTGQYVRIRALTGTAAQSVYTSWSADYGTNLKSTDKGAGIALAAVDCVYNPDVFPQGRPTVTALLRGAKVYDPRKDSTVTGGSGAHRLATASTWEWTQNPALIAYDYARWAYGWNVPADKINTADVMAAADACDVSTSFTLRNPDLSTRSVTLPRHRCDIVLSSGADPAENMQQIVDTMNGRVWWAGGTLRMRAAELRSTALAADSTWFMEGVNASGEADGQPVIQAASAFTRTQRYNRVVGTFADEDGRYQMLPYPAVEDSTLIAAKGERELTQDLPGTTHVAHAQHLGSMAIRAAQAGQRLEARMGVKALALEVGDVFSVTHSRFGMSAKLYECVGWRWGADGTVNVQGAEVSAALFTVDSELKGKDPAPDSTLRSPWVVEAVTGLAVTSGTTALTDGSILSRVQVSWTAATDISIRRGGSVEIQYWPSDQALPTDDNWLSWVETGTATVSVIPGLLTNRTYLFRARFITAPPVVVRGNWCGKVRHLVDGSRKVDTGDIVDNAVAEVFEDTFDNAGGAFTTSAGSASSTSQLRTYTFTPAADCTLEISASADADGLDWALSRTVSWTVIVGGSTVATIGSAASTSTADRKVHLALGSYAATGGTAVTLALNFVHVPFTAVTMHWWVSYMRATAVYK